MYKKNYNYLSRQGKACKEKIGLGKTLCSVSLRRVDSTQCQPTLKFRKFFKNLHVSQRYSFLKKLTLRSQNVLRPCAKLISNISKKNFGFLNNLAQHAECPVFFLKNHSTLLVKNGRVKMKILLGTKNNFRKISSWPRAGFL